METLEEEFSFSENEQKILNYWKEIDAFQTSLKKSEGKPEYSFYDGPPFATGLPHYGHILAGTIKDTVTRYWHQNGFHVTRRFGWDCHGLPIEFEIDKEKGIKTRDDVLKMGIPEYNKACRGIVMKFSAEWEKTVTRLGRWIDFRNDYKTLDITFMESVWNVLYQVHQKGLLYRGFRVMPYSIGCSTPLSNFEANLDYRDTVDPTVVVSFPLREDENVSLVAWTTTPWTLPSNLALCVNPDLEYVKIQDKTTKVQYIICKERVVEIYTDPTTYEVLSTFKGKELEGKKYVPIFDYFKEEESKGAFRVLVDNYVTNSSGTGIVHQAPAFGEDDYRVCLNNGIIAKGEGIPCPVDESGRFTSVVKEFAGRNVKEADNDICANLKSRKRLVKKGNLKHSYPFCWRSGTPLIYKAVPSWFIAVEKIRDQLVENVKETRWVPDAIREGRFHNWLADARDWTISRSRFWGTPIPVWLSDDKEEMVVIGSIEELERRSGVKGITDLHKESIDHITIPSEKGKGVLRRVEDVFDCWFESGSMPYAQIHYPFENKEKFNQTFPADFIAEGIDQTRGWFYTLLVLSTILHQKAPYKNVVVNGLVLAEDGRKMSKKERNYPDPNLVIDEYGADALRLYLIDSPVVRGENLRFKKEGVWQICKDVFRPWYHAFRFFSNAFNKFSKGTSFRPDRALALSSQNLMDKWILAATSQLVQNVRKEMEAYELSAVLPKLTNFIEQLTNWYLKFNRTRLKGSDGPEDTKTCLSVMFEVFLTISKTMAPFTPFLAEFFYQRLRPFIPENEREDSVHYCEFPHPIKEALNPRIVEAVGNMQSVILLGRTARERRTKPVSFPLTKITSINSDPQFQADIEQLKDYILEQLNVKEIVFASDSQSVVNLAKPDNKKLGARLGKAFGAVSAAIKQLSNEQIRQFQSTGSVEVQGHVLSSEDLIIQREFKGDKTKEEAAWDNKAIVVLDLVEDQKLIDEGLIRRVVNLIQRLRKKAKLQPTDPVEVFYQAPAAGNFQKLVEREESNISKRVNLPLTPLNLLPPTSVVLGSEEGDIEGNKFIIKIAVLSFGFNTDLLSKSHDNQFVEDLKFLVRTRDYQSVEKELSSKGFVEYKLNDVSVKLESNKHIFKNCSESRQ